MNNEREMIIAIEGMRADIQVLAGVVRGFTHPTPPPALAEPAPPDWLVRFWYAFDTLCTDHMVAVSPGQAEVEGAFVVRLTGGPRAFAYTDFAHNKWCSENEWLVLEEDV